MRIVGGALRGKRLKTPEGDAVRPTSDRAREALFNRLEHGDYGFPRRHGIGERWICSPERGALGLEALSRGAVWCTFVEEAAAPRGVIRDNIETFDAIGRTKLYRRDATALGPRRGAPFDLIFLDPPYGHGLAWRALASARAGGWIAPAAVVVIETEAAAPRPTLEWLPEGDRRQVGAAAIEIAQAVF